jgi:hypothetical protein
MRQEERRSLKQLLDTSHIRNLAQIDYAKAHPPEGAQPQEEEDHHAPHPIEPEDMPATVQLLARCLRFNLQELGTFGVCVCVCARAVLCCAVRADEMMNVQSNRR